MCATQVGKRGAAGMVAILDQFSRGIPRTRAEVHRQHRFRIGQPAPVDEFIGAELVGLGGHPGKVQAAWSARRGTDPVLPVVAGNEIAARIAHDRGRQLAHQRKHVPAKTMGVGRRMTRFEYAAVDTATQMLDESTEQAAVRFADHLITMKIDIHVIHSCLSPSRLSSIVAP